MRCSVPWEPSVPLPSLNLYAITLRGSGLANGSPVGTPTWVSFPLQQEAEPGPAPPPRAPVSLTGPSLAVKCQVGSVSLVWKATSQASQGGTTLPRPCPTATEGRVP